MDSTCTVIIFTISQTVGGVNNVCLCLMEPYWAQHYLLLSVSELSYFTHVNLMS